MRKGNINNKSKEYNNIQSDENAVFHETNTEDVIKENSTNNSISQGNNGKNKDKIRISILIIIIVLSLGITAGLLIYKYTNINSQQPTGESGNNNYEVETKKETEDKKYLVSFTDMYEVNPIKITDKEYEQKASKKQGYVGIQYVEISGLQDKKLQDRINKEIKTNAYYFSDKTTAKQSYYSYTSVQGNFSNILSVHTNIYVYQDEEVVFEENINLNYNLATGEQIKFLDLFASNTPMNSIIYDLEYERLAWDVEYNFDMSEKEWDKATNMDHRDTSEYEELIFKVINRYKNLDKDKINFFVTPNSINLSLAVGEGGEEISYFIDLYKYIDYVTLYKKFLTDDVVFENTVKNKLLVFNDMLDYTLEYYKIESDNLFMSLISYDDWEYSKEQEKEQINKYSQGAVNKKNELMKKHKENILNEVRKLAKSNKNKGYMARFMPYSYIDDYSNDYGSETLIYVSLDGAIEEMDINYYKENAFKLLAAQNARPRASIDDLLVGSIAYEDNKNVKNLLYNEDEKDIIDLSGYYTLDGTLVAKTYEEVEKYIDSKFKKPEPEHVTEEQTEVDIYKEEQQ